MIKCSYCGRENSDELSACHECGGELSASSCAAVKQGTSTRIIWVMACLLAFGFLLYRSRIEYRPTEFDHGLIRGTGQFKEHVCAALALLKTKSPQAYGMVTNYIRIFVQSKHSGMAAYERPPTSYLHDKFEWQSSESYAAGIAHESFHSKLYHDFLRTNAWVPDLEWTGENAERLCCEHQLQVLKAIGASAWDLTWSAWNPSNRYWEIPFEKRDW